MNLSFSEALLLRCIQIKDPNIYPNHVYLSILHRFGEPSNYNPIYDPSTVSINSFLHKYITNLADVFTVPNSIQHHRFIIDRLSLLIYHTDIKTREKLISWIQSCQTQEFDNSALAL